MDENTAENTARGDTAPEEVNEPRENGQGSSAQGPDTNGRGGSDAQGSDGYGQQGPDAGGSGGYGYGPQGPNPYGQGNPGGYGYGPQGPNGYGPGNPGGYGYGPQGPNPYGPGNPGGYGYGPQGQNGYGSGNPGGYGYGPQGPNGYGSGNPGGYGYGPQGPNPYGGRPTGPHGKRIGTGPAIASMVCGIIAAVLFLTFINIPLAIAAIVLGIIYLVNYEPVERGFAIVGIATGVLSFVLMIASIAVIANSPLLRSFQSAPSDRDEIIEEYNDAIEDYYDDMFGDGSDF